MTYDEKLAYANAYLQMNIGLDWEDLPDINSLHDCDTEEEIKDACKERAEEDGFMEDEFSDYEE